MTEYKSFFKTVGGGEGEHCKYPTRLDTYGRGCQHDCDYCYAKSLLDFRGLWNAKDPAVADINKIRRRIEKLRRGSIVRLGGMTDCFQPMEKQKRVTLETIKALNNAGVGYLIVTKSDMVADSEYMNVMDRSLAHIQITITCFDDERYRKLAYEKAPLPSKRIAAVEALQRSGFDVAVRLSPFIPQFVDYDKLNAIECDKILVEFLRINTAIQKLFNIDCSEYTVKQGNYRHLPLEKKLELLKRITGFQQTTVCEDENRAYEYWRENFNPNKNDCCNLRV